MKRNLMFLLMTFLCLSVCGQIEIETFQLENGEFLMEVEYGKSIAETVHDGKFGYVDKEIIENYAIYENQGTNQGKTIVIAAIITFNKKVSSAEAKDLLAMDGRYRGANIYELLALNKQFKHPYFNSYNKGPKVIDIGNGLKILDYTLKSEIDSRSNSLVLALDSGIWDFKSLPGWSPWVTAFIYDRDIRTLQIRQEFPRGEIKDMLINSYSSDAYLVVRK